jgi:hypothetical protein
MSRATFLVALGFAVSLLSPLESLAVCSVSACNPLYFTCRAAATVDQNGCRSACKGGGGGSDCSRACSDASRAAAAVCKTAKAECKTACSISDVACAGDCATAVKTCANYKAIEKPCLLVCKTAVKDALALCGSDDQECKNQAWLDFGACYQACADDIADLGAGCQASFDTCIDACGS